MKSTSQDIVVSSVGRKGLSGHTAGVNSLAFSPQQIQNTLVLREEIIPETSQWTYTTEKPPDDSGWQAGQAPFGLDSTILGIPLERRPNTLWWEDDIWLRHTFLAQVDDVGKPLVLNAFVNDYADVFLNGVSVPPIDARPKEGDISSNWWEGIVELAPDLKLKPGKERLGCALPKPSSLYVWQDRCRSLPTR